jgi:hypothetical protein
MRALRVTPLVSIATALLAGTGLAQSDKPDKPLPVIRGAVQDTLGRGLEGAQVEIVGLERTATTGVKGSYRIDGVTPGKYWVVARRIGYAPLRAALSFNPGDDREVVFQLEPLAHILPDEVVTASDLRWQQRFNDFVWRSRASSGRFLTRDDLQREQRRYLDQVVSKYLVGIYDHSLGALSVGSGWGRSSLGWASSASSGFGSGGCVPLVSLNGSRPLGGWQLSDFRTEDVEAVEIYGFTRSLPMEFQNWAGRCGLVVVWTR